MFEIGKFYISPSCIIYITDITGKHIVFRYTWTNTRKNYINTGSWSTTAMNHNKSKFRLMTYIEIIGRGGLNELRSK